MTVPRRRWFRFSLRTLFVVVTVFASLAALSRLGGLVLLLLVLLVLLVAILVIIAVAGIPLAIVCYCVAARRLKSPRPTDDVPVSDAEQP